MINKYSLQLNNISMNAKVKKRINSFIINFNNKFDIKNISINTEAKNNANKVFNDFLTTVCRDLNVNSEDVALFMSMDTSFFKNAKNILKDSIHFGVILITKEGVKTRLDGSNIYSFFKEDNEQAISFLFSNINFLPTTTRKYVRGKEKDSLKNYNNSFNNLRNAFDAKAFMKFLPDFYMPKILENIVIDFENIDDIVLRMTTFIYFYDSILYKYPTDIDNYSFIMLRNKIRQNFTFAYKDILLTMRNFTEDFPVYHRALNIISKSDRAIDCVIDDVNYHNSNKKHNLFLFKIAKNNKHREILNNIVKNHLDCNFEFNGLNYSLLSNEFKNCLYREFKKQCFSRYEHFDEIVEYKEALPLNLFAD